MWELQKLRFLRNCFCDSLRQTSYVRWRRRPRRTPPQIWIKKRRPLGTVFNKKALSNCTFQSEHLVESTLFTMFFLTNKRDIFRIKTLEQPFFPAFFAKLKQSCIKFKKFNSSSVHSTKTELELLLNSPLNFFELSSKSIQREWSAPL